MVFEKESVAQSATYKKPGDYDRFYDQVKSAFINGICPLTIQPTSKALPFQETQPAIREECDSTCRWTD